MAVTVGIIGGRGHMGQWFKRFFEEQGLEVLISEPGMTPSPSEVAGRVDVVVISVPLHLTETVIRELAPHIRPEALLMDLTSLKQGPVAAMLEAFPGEVVGTHPLFGPGEKSMTGLNMVLCRGRGERWFTWLHDLLAGAGAAVEITTAEEHDTLMSLVQGLTHFSLIALGATLRTVKADLSRLKMFATPTFQVVFDQVQNLVNQSYPLYACIQLRNPANPAILAAYEEAVTGLRQLVVNQDAPGLIRVLEDNSRYLKETPKGEDRN